MSTKFYLFYGLVSLLMATLYFPTVTFLSERFASSGYSAIDTPVALSIMVLVVFLFYGIHYLYIQPLRCRFLSS